MKAEVRITESLATGEAAKAIFCLHILFTPAKKKKKKEEKKRRRTTATSKQTDKETNKFIYRA